MSWWDELSSTKNLAPAKPAPKGLDWWGEVAAPGPTISQAPQGRTFTATTDVSRMAPASRQAVASLPTGAEDRARYFASRRFPDMPVDQALNNYFYVGDRLAYRAPDGGQYFEEATFTNPLKAGGMAQNARALASGAGPAMAPVVATGAAIPSMAASGGLAGVPAAMAGGAAGDATRQFLANRLAGEQKDWLDRGAQVTGAALQEGIGQLIGNGVGRVLQFLGKTPTFDIPVTTNLRDLSTKFGIPLTAGEETGNRTLLRRQKILANTTEGEQRFTNFYEGRNEKVAIAVNTMLNKISPNASPRMASAAGVEGAQDAIATEQRALSALSRPAYERAESGIVPLSELTGGPAGGRIQLALNAVQKNRAYKDTVGAMPQDTLPVVDAAKKWIDDQVKVAERSGKNNEARLWSEAAEELRTIADQNVPAYGEARGIFEANVPTRNALQNGVVGDMARLEGPETLRAGNIIFGKGSSPEDIRAARSAFEKAGKSQNWNDLVRSQFQQIFEEVPDSATGSITNIGGTYRKALMGNPSKRSRMAAALEHDPAVWQEFNDLMTVLDATGRAMKGESITAFAQAGQKELEREARGIAPALIEAVEIWKAPSNIARYWSDLRTGAYAARQAELLTTPQGREALRELRKLGPGSKGSVIALSHFLTAPSFAAVGDYLEPERNGPVLPIADMPADPRLAQPGLGNRGR